MGSDTRVLLRGHEEDWRQPSMSGYSDERMLQQLLVETPTLIPGVGRAVAVDELYVPGAGNVDVVAVEPSGHITLVECKLRRNADARRAVVGQILSYAAATQGMTERQFAERFHQRAGRSLRDAISELGIEQDPEWNGEEFDSALAATLESGSFRLVIAVDEISDELKGSVEYLNTHTSGGLEILALVAGYLEDDDLEVMLLDTHGRESARIGHVAQGGTRDHQRRPCASPDLPMRREHGRAHPPQGRPEPLRLQHLPRLPPNSPDRDVVERPGRKLSYCRASKAEPSALFCSAQPQHTPESRQPE